MNLVEDTQILWDHSVSRMILLKQLRRLALTVCYLCRDHGGPWQRDEERNAHLPEDEAAELAKKSYLP